MTIFKRIWQSLFGTKQQVACTASIPAKKPRKGMTTSDFVLLNLRARGSATTAQIASDLDANTYTVGNCLAKLKHAGKVKTVGRVGREYVWELT